MGKGTRISGKIVNPTSVVHENAQFSARIDEHRGTFALTRVPPGVAQPFEVTLPDVAPGEAKKAFFALQLDDQLRQLHHAQGARAAIPSTPTSC